jgi:tRNA-splicing ligase RtcB
MPDFHVGYGMPIGGVFATRGGVVPNAVGVDIGCGMIAVRTEYEANALDRGTLEHTRQAVHRRVPVGFKHQDRAVALWDEAAEFDAVKAPVLAKNLEPAGFQVGTLGGGNHFIEVQADEEGFVWFMVHSGSRNIGQQVCKHYDGVARKYMERFHAAIPDRDLAFLPEEVPEYDEYLAAMTWCCRFAEESRERMVDAVFAAFEEVTGRTVSGGTRIQTHHNYAAMEEHLGEELLVHRKGAVRAEGPVIIPGSMGTASYIAEGKANPVSFRTCSHGAGRVMGRKEANRTITHAQAVNAMAHVVFGVRQGDYEEMPQAYKDIDVVMENQRDLADPEHRLKPLAVVKG